MTIVYSPSNITTVLYCIVHSMIVAELQLVVIILYIAQYILISIQYSTKHVKFILYVHTIHYEYVLYVSYCPFILK